MRDLLRRVWYVIRQRQFERDLAEEIEFHRAMAQRDLEQRGLGAATADRAARRLLGNTTLAREDSRGVWIWPWLESIWQDAAYAMRNLRRQPGFTGRRDRGARNRHRTAHDAGHRDRGRRAAAVARHARCRPRRRRVSARPGRRSAGFAGGLPLSAYRTVAERATIAERRRRDTCRRGAGRNRRQRAVD